MAKEKNDNQERIAALAKSAENVAFVLKKGEISVSDDLVFMYTADVLNALGAHTAKGEPYKAWGSGLAHINDGRCVWFPHLDRSAESNNNWHNIFVNSEHITETYQGRELDNIWQERARAFDAKHPVRYLVFANFKNEKGYEYLGTFEMAGYDYAQRPYKTFWKRVETSAKVCGISKDKR